MHAAAAIGSLRWLLTALLLLESGVSLEVLTARLQQHQPYLHFHRQARRWLPACTADRAAWARAG